MGIYRGADTMEAERSQSLWDVLQGQKIHKKTQDTQLGNKAIASTFGDILKKVSPGYGHIADVGIDVFSEKYLPIEEYDEEGGSFWGSKQIAEYGEQAEAISRGADTSLLESIIGNIGDYVGVGTDKPNPFKGFLDEGNRGGDVAEVGGYKEIDNYSPFDIFKGGDWREQLSSFLDTGTRTSYKEQGGRVPKYKNGGQVPQYYGGGSVSGNPTIAGYFSQQGKTLGGSNTQSLAEKLGRK